MQNNHPQNNANPLNPIARRNARRLVIQAMYQWVIARTPVAEIEIEFLKDQSTYKPDQKLDLIYFKELLHEIPKLHVELDNSLSPFLDRPITELDVIELSVLRLAMYEFLHRLDVPYQVVINEALELTKRFGSIEGYKFVNGVLDNAAKKIRIPESNK